MWLCVNSTTLLTSSVPWVLLSQSCFLYWQRGFAAVSSEAASSLRNSQLESVQQQNQQVHPEGRICDWSPRLSRPWFGFLDRSYCFSYCPEDAAAYDLSVAFPRSERASSRELPVPNFTVFVMWENGLCCYWHPAICENFCCRPIGR